MDPRRRDLLIAVVLGVEMQIEALFVPEYQALVHGLVLVLALALAVRTRFPLASFFAAMAGFFGLTSLGTSVGDAMFISFFVGLFFCFSVAYNTPGRVFWIAPPVAFLGGLASSIVDDYDDPIITDIFFISLIFVAAPMVAGRLLRNRAQLQRALREKASHLERVQARDAARAVADERARIAGDLHDIVAHALTDMTVQASAAGRLAGRDETLAREAFAAVEGRGREALGELRRLLGVLRSGDEELALAPAPSLRHLDALVGRAGASGLPVVLAVEGEATDLPPGIDVTGYRVVQEALNRALRDHAAGRADVRVRYAGDRVDVEVSDDGFALTDDGPPLGLRERVALYGGELTAGPRDGGGHVMRVRLPREVPA
jgi:signal transduction histidine kinase